MIAVVKTGGKQYKVAEGDEIQVGKIDGNASETTGNGDGKHESEKGAVQEHLIVRTTRDRENDGSEAISETLRSGLRFDDWRGRGTVGSICRDENSRDVRLGRHFAKRSVVVHRRSGCVFSEKRWERRFAGNQIGVERVIV